MSKNLLYFASIGLGATLFTSSATTAGPANHPTESPSVSECFAAVPRCNQGLLRQVNEPCGSGNFLTRYTCESPSGSSLPIKSAHEETELSQRRAQSFANTQRTAAYDTRQAGDGDCAYSEGIGSQYGCKKTNTYVRGAEISNQATQIAGSAATQLAGGAAITKAQNAGTQSAALEGAASTQKTAAQLQMSTGILNSTLGILQLQQAQKHKKNEAAMDRLSKTQLTANGNSLTATAGNQNIANGTLNGYEIQQAFQKRAQEINSTPGLDPATKQAMIERERLAAQERFSRVNRNAAQEQSKAGETASGGGTTSLITGLTQMMNGVIGLKSAKEMKTAAKNLQNVENLGNRLPGFDNLPSGDATAPNQNSSILGNGTSTSTDESAATDEGSLTNNKPLDEPFNPDGLGGGDVANAPPAAPFRPKEGGGPSGGGGGGGLGGGSTQAAAKSEEEGGGAAYSEMVRNSGVASAAGSAPVGGGGGSGANSNGPDLAGLLKQFLPNQEDANKPRNGGIEVFGRQIAQESPPSLLGRDACIFCRIHDKMVEKATKGYVGN